MFKRLFQKNRSKWLKIAIIATIVIAFIYIIYMWVIQPIVAKLFISAKEYKGVDIYFEKEYLEFDDGKTFENAISTVPFLDETNIVGFEYHDNRKSDNIFYGKMCDAYILEVNLGDQYENAKEYIFEIGKYCCYIDDYSFYWFEDSVSNDKDSFFVAFCDDAQIVRLILVADCDNIFSMAVRIDAVIGTNFSVDWTSPF